MRFNDGALHALVSSRPPDRQGVLSHQSPKDGTRKKHFKLIGNLLFNQKVEEGDISSKSDPENIGVMLMEKCHIEMVGVASSKIFSIMFDGENFKKHYFTAGTAQECQSWVTALQIASYSNLVVEIQYLRDQIQAKTRVDPMNAAQQRVLAQAMKPLKRGNATIASKYRSERGYANAPQVSVPKNKKGGGSTFYTGSDAGSGNSTKHMARHTVPTSKSKTVPPVGPQSKFFTELEVVRAAAKPNTEERIVSSRLDELRRKAMTIPREVTERSNTGPSTNIDFGATSVRSGFYGKPDFDTELLDLVDSGRNENKDGPNAAATNNQPSAVDDLLGLNEKYVKGDIRNTVMIPCVSGSIPPQQNLQATALNPFSHSKIPGDTTTPLIPFTANQNTPDILLSNQDRPSFSSNQNGLSLLANPSTTGIFSTDTSQKPVCVRQAVNLKTMTNHPSASQSQSTNHLQALNTGWAMTANQHPGQNPHGSSSANQLQSVIPQPAKASNQQHVWGSLPNQGKPPTQRATGVVLDPFDLSFLEDSLTGRNVHPQGSNSMSNWEKF